MINMNDGDDGKNKMRLQAYYNNKRQACMTYPTNNIVIRHMLII